MKIGVIWAGFNCEDTLDRSLAPWIAARRDKLGGHDFVICAVSVPFEGFGEEATDKTRTLLGFASTRDDIDHAIVRDRPMKETEARGAALRWLTEKGCDLSIMVDADEFYSTDEISRIMTFVSARPLIAAFKGSFRNCVFDENTYVTQPFRPMRIHRVRYGDYLLDSFWDDNNALYRAANGDFKRDIDLPVAQIPQSVQFTKHLTWISDERSRKKCEYQTKARGWECSFRWNYSLDRLEWNESYFRANGLSFPPETRKD